LLLVTNNQTNVYLLVCANGNDVYFQHFTKRMSDFARSHIFIFLVHSHIRVWVNNVIS